MELMVLQCLFLLIYFSLLTNLLQEGVLRSLQVCKVSGSKLHLVGTLKRSFFDFPNSFLMRKEKLARIYKKTANI
jgi:flagellar biosynthesis protein FlhB